MKGYLLITPNKRPIYVYTLKEAKTYMMLIVENKVVETNCFDLVELEDNIFIRHFKVINGKIKENKK